MNLFITYRVLLFLTVCGFWVSCSEKATMQNKTETFSNDPVEKNYSEIILSPGEYIQWFKSDENHLRKAQTVNGIQYTLEYRSPEFVALLQEQNENITKTELDSVMQDFSDLLQFRLLIEVPGSQQEFLKHNLSADADYEARVKYYAFDMQKDITLKTEQGDSIPCAMYHFERTYNVSPSCVFLLGFVSVNTNEKMEITIYDKEIGKEKIRFVFDPQELKNIPQLKTL